jgi:lysophospholipase L1-like esterase
MADRRPIVAGALALAAAALAACGGGGDAAATPTATPTIIASSSPAPADPVAITAPRPGLRVPAGGAGGGRLRARIVVRGRAAPDTAVLLSGGCTAVGCEALARAASDGTWRAKLTVVAPRGRPRATIAAASSADAGDTTSVSVRLKAKPGGAPAPPASTTAKPAAPPASQPSGTGGTVGSGSAAARPRRLVMIGDSLAQGTEPFLPGLLPGWQVTTYAARGRPLADGMRLLSATGLGGSPVVLAMSLFTNDDPRNVAALASAVRTSAARSGGGCAVWATIVRPPLGGVSYQAANSRLEQLASEPGLAGRLLIVPWAAQVAAHPGWLAGDGVHATPEGYRARAQMYADAARACGG